MKSFATTILIIHLATHLYAQLLTDEGIDFKKADSIAALYPKHSLNNLKCLADKLTRPLHTQEEKFRAIYKWICNNIENDYRFYVINKHKREKLKDTEKLKKWNKEFSIRVFDKLLNEYKTVCSGYAYLIKELCYHAGITCKIVDGYGRTSHANIGGAGIPNHSWNAVQLNNKWYLCDATWSSGSIDTQKGSFVKKFSSYYFMADPTLFVRNHYPLDTAWVLLHDKPTLEQFLNGPLIYGSAYHYKISPVSPESFDITIKKGENVSFSFIKWSDEVIDQVELQINGGTGMNSYYPEIQKDVNGHYLLNHKFTAKGTFIIHILFNADYVVTYSAKVR